MTITTTTTSTTATPEEMKLCLMGAGGVGKSTITVQFVQNIFLEEHDPTIDDCYRKRCEVDGKHYLLDILDTSGFPEEYTFLKDQYIKCTHGFILVFALNDRSSFAELSDLVDRILRIKEQDSFPILMVGNKVDLEDERVIDSEEARAMARALRIEYMECTAKKSVDHVFRQIVRSAKIYVEHQCPVSSNRKCTIM